MSQKKIYNKEVIHFFLFLNCIRRAKSSRNLPFQTVPDIDDEIPKPEWEPNPWQVATTQVPQRPVQTPTPEQSEVDNISDAFIAF